MSLHLYSEFDMISSPTNIDSATREESSDSESPYSSARVSKLKEELIRKNTELDKIKREKKLLNTQLLQAQDDMAMVQQEYDDKVKALHKATCNINELVALCDKREGEIAELKSSMEATSVRGCRLTSCLESLKKEYSLVNLENSRLEEKNANLKEEVRNLKRSAHNSEELLEELEKLRMSNLNLRRNLAAVTETEYGSLTGIPGEDQSPERMTQFHLDQRNGGMNLHQELSMLGSPLPATFSRSCQFPSSEDILEGLYEKAPAMNAATQTENLPVADCFTQAEVVPAITMSTQTREIRRWNAQTDRVPSQSFATASGRTTTSNEGSDSITTNGVATALQPNRAPCQSRGTSSNLSQPMFSSSSEPNFVGCSSNYRFWWICMIAILCLIFALIGNGGRINITPLVNSCRSGLKFHYKKAMPPH